MPVLAPFVMPTLAAVAVYSAVQQSKATSAAKSEAKKQRQQQEAMFNRELEAGEYYTELQAQQIELQSQTSTINTLAALIDERRQPTPQQIITLPAAKEYSALEQMNQAIDKMVRG